MQLPARIVSRLLVFSAQFDGLRALAIAAVIFFHAGFKTFSGGFVGVDVIWL